jgi:hypothetical protein
MHKIFEYTSQNFSNGNHFHLSRSSQRRFLANNQLNIDNKLGFIENHYMSEKTEQAKRKYAEPLELIELEPTLRPLAFFHQIH